MDELESLDVRHTTEWALLFPLRTGLLSLKSSFNSLADSDTVLDDLYKAEYYSQQNISTRKMTSGNSSARSSVENLHPFPNVRMRRRSSMSDLDKIGGLQVKVSNISRSATSNSYDHECRSTPNSPHARYMSQMHKSDNVRGSIGDFMNFKRFGGSSGFRTETIIAKTVPLTTVTKKSNRECHPLRRKLLNDDEYCLKASKSSLKGSRSSFDESRSSMESIDGYLKSNRNRKCGVAFSENIIMQHFIKNPYELEKSDLPVMELIESMENVPSSQSRSVNSGATLVLSVQNGESPEVPLSGSQRTERLSRLIRQHRSTHQLYANISVSFYSPGLKLVFRSIFAISMNLRCGKRFPEIRNNMIRRY